jgi:hypothetical protein
MLSTNIEKAPIFIASFFQQTVTRYSFSISSIPQNIQKVAIPIIAFYGLANIATVSSELTNAGCKKLCMRFLQGSDIKIIEDCLYDFCNKFFPM